MDLEFGTASIEIFLCLISLEFFKKHEPAFSGIFSVRDKKFYAPEFLICVVLGESIALTNRTVMKEAYGHFLITGCAILILVATHCIHEEAWKIDYSKPDHGNEAREDQTPWNNLAASNWCQANTASAYSLTATA